MLKSSEALDIMHFNVSKLDVRARLFSFASMGRRIS